MMSLELFKETGYHKLVVLLSRLIHLVEMVVCRHFRCVYREWYQHFYIVLLGKVGKRLHLLGV